MRKVHITLVGGQPIPIYIGIKDDGQVNTVVLVCSMQSRDEANRISSQFPKRTVIIKECSPIDLDEIENLATQVSEEYSGYEKTINLTSGTKLWSLTFFRIFSQQDHVRFIYVDQTNVITNILSKQTHLGKIDTFKRFELYGTPLTSFHCIEDYSDEDMGVLKDIEYLRNKNRREFWKLTDLQKLNEDQDSDVIETDNGSSLEYCISERWAKVILRTGTKFCEKQLECEHLFDILFNNGWFELKTAKELRQNEQINNIWLNCEFTDTEGSPKNEIDIIAELGNRLLFVECKTMIHDSTDIDKFHSALRNFSGTSSAGIFVTNDKPNESSRSRFEHAMEKCKDNGILTFNFSLWKENPVGILPLKTLINNQIQTQNKR